MNNLERKVALGLAFTLALIILVGLYGATEPWRQRSAETKFRTQAMERGAEHYLITCALCHGPQGEGGVGPPLREMELKEGEMFKVISRGRGAMPAFHREEGGLFNDPQINDLITFIRHWDEGLLEEVRAKLGPLALPPTPSPPLGASPGEVLFRQLGCLTCHRINGEGGAVGPPLPGIFGQEVVLATGESLTRDEAYFQESVVDPNDKVVQGFPPAMPSYKGRLSPEQLKELIDFLKGLTPRPTSTPSLTPTPTATITPGPTPTPTPVATPSLAAGEKLVRDKGCLACHKINGEGGALGPSLAGIWSKPVTLTTGQTLTRDQNYIEESVLNPGAKVVQGFQPLMPPFPLSQEELEQLIDYLKNLPQ